MKYLYRLVLLMILAPLVNASGGLEKEQPEPISGDKTDETANSGSIVKKQSEQTDYSAKSEQEELKQILILQRIDQEAMIRKLQIDREATERKLQILDKLQASEGDNEWGDLANAQSPQLPDICDNYPGLPPCS